MCPGSTVRALLPMADCLEEVRAGFLALEEGRADLPLRFGYKLPQEQFSVLASMPAFTMVADVAAAGESHAAEAEGGSGAAAPAEGGGAVGIPFCASKTITVFPHNSKLNKHSHTGTISLFEGIHGGLLALIDAGEVTGLRTAAASAVATDLLARADATVLALLGCGTQGHTHVEALLLVRPGLRRVQVWSRSGDKVAAFVAAQAGLHPGLEFVQCATPAAAAAGADVICTLTPSQEALLDAADVKPGCHINAVGACTPNHRELGRALVARAALFTDRRESCLKEPGEIVDCLREGLITADHVRGELGELLAGTAAGRRDDDEVTVFESLGIAVQDLYSALRIYRNCISRAELPPGCVQVKF